MAKKRDPHSVFNEPHLRPEKKRADPSEAKAEQTLGRARRDDAEYRDGQSVYDEPDILPGRPPEVIEQDWSCTNCGYNLRGLPAHHPCPECGHRELYRPAPQSAQGYRAWLTRRMAGMTSAQAWTLAVLLALCGGPWAILVAVLGSGKLTPPGVPAVLLITTLGPVVEETMKIATAAWVVERRPYWFRRLEQLQTATFGAALCFAVIENLVYLNLYLPNASVLLSVWRWTVCLALHLGCTMLATRGLAIVWQRTVTELRPPKLTLGLRWLGIAIVVHGCYNAGVAALEFVLPF